MKDKLEKQNPKKPRFMQRETKQWASLANSMARDYAPEIHQCKECGAPVISGYCCTRCGSTNP